MVRGFLEEARRTEVLSNFRNEVLPEIQQEYQDRWDEQIEIVYEDPMANTFTGPSAMRNEASSLDFSVRSSLYEEDLSFMFSVHEVPFSAEEVLDSQGNIDEDALRGSYSYLGRENSFEPEKKEMRFLQFSPDLVGEEPDSFEDRWHVFNQVIEEIIQPELNFSLNGYDHVYAVPFRDTQSRENGYGSERQLMDY